MLSRRASDAEAGGLDAVRCRRVRGISEDFLEAASWAIQVDPACVPKPQAVPVTLDVIQSGSVSSVHELAPRPRAIDPVRLARLRSKAPYQSGPGGLDQAAEPRRSAPH